MGWMSWQFFRCETDCASFPTSCIDEALYRAQADELVRGGYAAAGYTGIHLDDCILDITGRDPKTHELRADPLRFPSGFRATGDYLHARNLSFGFYTAESTTTCGGWPGSRDFEKTDANTFASWGVDFLKADGCGDPSYYPVGYPAMGRALEATGRDIVYSCSWPAYLGDDESVKPFAAFIAAGCSTWRNYIDMGPTVGYLQGILEHFGNYSEALALWAGPGHWHDPDQLLAGTDGISDDAARSQMALYCILASPLILGNDLRAVSPTARDIIINHHAIAVNQDPLGRMGVRLGGAAAQNAPTQVWFRPLAGGEVAVGLYNAGAPAAHPWHSDCATGDFNATAGGYWASSAPPPAAWCSSALGADLLAWYCCNTADCAGWHWDASTSRGCMLKAADGAWVPGSANVSGATRVGFVTPTGAAADISVAFADVGLFPGAAVTVFDIWAGRVVAVTNGTQWTARVPWQGTAFYRLSTTAAASSPVK